MNWTAIGLMGFGAFIIADLLVFRFAFPRHTVEDKIMRIVNGLGWVLAAVLVMAGLVWMI